MNYAELTDEALMRLVLGGDDKAFNTLAQRHEDWIYYYAYFRCRHDEQAEDCCQEVLIKLWLRASERMLSTMKICGFHAYVRVMVNNHFNTSGQKSDEDLTEDGVLPHDDSMCTLDPDDKIDATLQLEKILAALDAKKIKRNEVFVLQVFCDFSVKEVSDMMGISESAVSSAVHDARTELRKKFGWS